VSLPGSSSANPAKLRLFGCTTEAHAVREGLYLAAANRYRRRIITLRTELEGLIPTYGDLIAIAHDMPSWGTSGEIVGFDIASRAMTSSVPLPWEEGAEHYLAFQQPDGSVAGITFRTEMEGLIPTFGDLIAISHDMPARGIEGSTTGESADIPWSQLARVMAIRPRGEQVEIACVVEHPLVHTADQ